MTTLAPLSASDRRADWDHHSGISSLSACPSVCLSVCPPYTLLYGRCYGCCSTAAGIIGRCTTDRPHHSVHAAQSSHFLAHRSSSLLNAASSYTAHNSPSFINSSLHCLTLAYWIKLVRLVQVFQPAVKLASIIICYKMLVLSFLDCSTHVIVHLVLKDALYKSMFYLLT